MYNFTGCPCSVCGKPLAAADDIVVCPDCGAPYHRACYEKAGACVNAAKHGAGFVWTPPAAAGEECRCPNCGAPNPADAVRCGHCGFVHRADAAAPPPRAAAAPSRGQAAGGFNYTRLYQEAQGGYRQTAADADETLDGIPGADWAAYLGPSSAAYIREFSQMKKYGRKTSISFSALLFGPFYFFYRKAWKPAFGFLALDILLDVPVLLNLLTMTGSSFAPALSSTTLTLLVQLASILGFVVMVVRGMYGKFLYLRSAEARIRRIRAQFPKAAQREVVLRAQGGVSWAAVVGIYAALIVLGAVFSLLLGPNMSAVTGMLILS